MTLLLLATVARALSVIAGASVAARIIVLIRQRPWASRTRRSGLQMVLAFSGSISFFALVSALGQQPVHPSTAVNAAYLGCFYLAHRFLSNVESESQPGPDYTRAARFDDAAVQEN